MQITRLVIGDGIGEGEGGAFVCGSRSSSDDLRGTIHSYGATIKTMSKYCFLLSV